MTYLRHWFRVAQRSWLQSKYTYYAIFGGMEESSGRWQTLDDWAKLLLQATS